MAAKAELQRIGADAQSAADACATYILDTLSEQSLTSCIAVWAPMLIRQACFPASR
jgi:hypothetical protein